MKPFDILVAGEINPDLILSGDVVPAFGQAEKLIDSAVLTVGSSSVITACGAARLGLKVAFVGVCGDDLFGRFMLDEMQQRDIECSAVIVDPDRSTGLTVILNRLNDRAMLTHLGAIDALTAGQLPDSLLAGARHLHVASYFLQTALRPGLPDLYRRAHALGLTTSLDTNWDPSGEWRGIEDLLPSVDVFLPNENEALAISGAASVEGAVASLVQRCGTLAIKCGAQGALAARGEEIVRVPARRVEVVDTVGAGDAFNAGFLYGFLSGWSLEKTLSLATSCGSLSARAAGGTVAQPTLEQAIRYL